MEVKFRLGVEEKSSKRDEDVEREKSGRGGKERERVSTVTCVGYTYNRSKDAARSPSGTREPVRSSVLYPIKKGGVVVCAPFEKYSCPSKLE